MATPTYPDPVAPTRPSPLYQAQEGSKCGDTFDRDIEVRYPYGAADIFVRDLPRLWHLKLDISRPYPALEEKIAQGIESATLDLDAYSSTGDVDQSNFDAIDALLDTASAYLDYCIALREEWEDKRLAFVSSQGVPEDEAREWLTLGLSADLPATLVGCEGVDPDGVVRMDIPNGSVDYACPGIGFSAIYREAWTHYKDTILKAAKQTRCAQEGLYALVAYNVNRKQGEVGPPRPQTPGGTIAPAPSKPPVATPQPLPGPQSPTEPEQAAGWSTGKMVAVGALVAGAAAGIYWLVTRSPRQQEPARVANWTYPEEAA